MTDCTLCENGAWMPLVTGGRKNSLVTVLCLHELAELVAGGSVSGGAVTVSFFRF